MTKSSFESGSNAPRNSPLLEVRSLNVYYGRDTVSGFRAVANLNFSIAPNEILALVGESGSGKSTVALSIMRLLRGEPKLTGSIEFLGQDVMKLSQLGLRSFRGGNVGMVFQDPFSYLNPVRTIGWQIGEAITADDRRKSAASIRSEVVSLLTMVGINNPAHVANLYPHQLSGGMRQRALIASAVASGPSLLIADEPTTALDVTVQKKIISLLLNLREQMGMAILLITHNLGVVAEMADRVVVLKNGEMVESGNVDAVFKAPKHPYTKALIDAVPRLKISRTAGADVK